MTKYPFLIADKLRASLPAPSQDGNWYVDVKVHDAWDGILVIDPSFHCIGIYVHRSISEYALPFEPEEIQALRAPCLTHRLLAQLPTWMNVWTISVLGIVVIVPAIFLLARTHSPLFALLNLPVIFLAWVGMYSCRGFPLMRFPIAITGLVFVIESIRLVVRHMTG